MLTILNDLHIGATRSAGTTLVSQLELRKHLVQRLSSLLPHSGDAMLLGDLFDTASIPAYDLGLTYNALCDWLEAHPKATLYNVAGNHDLSKVSTVQSSFQLLGSLVSRHFKSRYVHIEAPTMTPHGYVIPHVRNQDLFNLAIEAVPTCDFLFLHCNYDNGFAAQSDQSLNLSAQQAADCPAKRIVIAHEHHTKSTGKIVLPGNQMASSISDWLAPSDKRLARIEDGQLSLIPVARRADEFKELDWRNPEPTTAKFIRFTGRASQAEVNEALSVVNRYRAQSDAFVVGNGIEIETPDSVEEVFERSLDGVQAFDVVAALRSVLTADEMAIVETLL